MHEAMTAIDVATAKPAATVTIVSDVLLYREGLMASLGGTGVIQVIDSVAGQDALPVIVNGQPDAVLLDGAMPSCLQLARQIRTAAPRSKIVGFAISGGADRMADCAESGIAAFVDCDGNVDDLVRSISNALSGELACSPQLSAALCERLARLSSGFNKSAALTRREHEIAALIGLGCSNKEIANDLKIGPSTVKNHVHNILEKMNVKRRSAVVTRMTRM